jgi:hypothetical protein
LYHVVATIQVLRIAVHMMKIKETVLSRHGRALGLTVLRIVLQNFDYKNLELPNGEKLNGK